MKKNNSQKILLITNIQNELKIDLIVKINFIQLKDNIFIITIIINRKKDKNKTSWFK